MVQEQKKVPLTQSAWIVEGEDSNSLIWVSRKYARHVEEQEDL